MPDELLEATTLCGPEGYVRDRIEAYRDAGVTHLTITPVPTGDLTAETIIEKVKTWAS